MARSVGGRVSASKLLIPALITLLFAYSFYSTIVEVGAKPKQTWYAHVGDENDSWHLKDVDSGFWETVLFYQNLGLWMPNVTDKRLMLLAKVYPSSFVDTRVAVYADDCIEEFYVNGKPILSRTGEVVFSADKCFGCKHCEGVDLDLGRYLVAGENTIAIRISNIMGPAWYTFEWMGARFISYRNILLFTLAVCLGLSLIVLHGLRAQGPIRPTFMNIITLAVLLLLVGRLNYLYASTPTQALFWDEEYWLQGTYFYHLLFHRGDLSNPDWHDSTAIDHPHLFHYVLGAALDLAKVDVAKTSGGRSEWMRLILGGASVGLENPIDSEEIPGYSKLVDFRKRFLEDLGEYEPMWFGNDGLLVGRYTVFYVGVVFTALLVYFFTRYLNSTFAGVSAAYLLLVSDVASTVFQQVLSETLCYLLVLLSLIVFVHLFKALRHYSMLLRQGKGGGRPHKTVISYSVLEGLLLALALATKFNTGFMLVVLFVVFALAMVMAYGGCGGGARETKVYASVLVLILASGTSFFIALNPHLYSNPVGSTLEMVDYRLTWISIQSNVWKQRITGQGHRASLIYRKGVLLGRDVDGPLEVTLLQILLFTGLLDLARKASKEFRDFIIGPYTLLLVLNVTLFTVYALMVHIDDTRYYLPLVFCVCVNLGFGVDWVVRRMRGSAG